VKIALTETNGELDKLLNLLIPIWNLPWEFRNSWDRQTIRILCNDEVHRSLMQHLAGEEEFPRCSNLKRKKPVNGISREGAVNEKIDFH
jgi:hypothetical protein